MKQYLIIGNGVAAAACIEGIRQKDSQGSITVISGEKYRTYCRPLLSGFLEGRTELKKLAFRPDDFYRKNGCRVIYGDKAVCFDPQAQTVTLESGAVLEYDALCLATGSLPLNRRYPGLNTVERKCCFHGMNNALTLDRLVKPGTGVLILGAGLAGLHCAAGLAGRVAEVTVCDRSPQLLPQLLDAETAGALQKHMEQHGVTFRLGDAPVRFQGNTVVLQDGKRLRFDLLVMAQGAKGNTALMEAAGGEVGNGILVSDRMHTSLPRVYAAGACTEGLQSVGSARHSLMLLPDAYMQGHCAGVNMAGGSTVFDKKTLLHTLEFFGRRMVLAGDCAAPEDGLILAEKTPHGFQKFFIKENKLVGFILFGDTERAGIYTALLREQASLEQLDFAPPRREVALRPSGKNYRSEKLGGVV